MRRSICFLLLAALLSFSCSKDKESEETTSVATDAQIYSVKLAGDTIHARFLQYAKFSIDQLNGQIQNRDSLPFGTRIDSVKCGITTKGASKTIFYPDAENLTDSIVWNGTDSLNLSKKARFKIIAKDGITSKTYDIWANIYSIKADSFVWNQLSSNIVSGTIERQRTVLMPDSSMFSYIKTSAGFALYSSHINDGASWVKRELSGFPDNATIEMMPQCNSRLYVLDAAGALYQSAGGMEWAKMDVKDESGQACTVKALLGCLGNEIEVIIGTSEGDLLGTCSPTSSSIYKGDALPEDFPVKGFASISYERDYRSRLLLVAGDNTSGTSMSTSWMKTEGQSWLKITGGYKTISARRGAICVPYDGKLMLIGGLDDSGSKKDLYFSSDYGINWMPVEDPSQFMPGNFAARAGASVLTDNKDYVYIIGGEEKGKEGGKALNDVWRGRIHRLSK